LSAPFILVGCASDKGGDVYTRDQVRQIQHFKIGTVESVRKVRIEGTRSQVGTTVGSIVGGMDGAAAAEGYTREDGIEMAIKLEDGSYISVMQAANIIEAEEIKTGDKVRVIEGDRVTRATKF
jgi:outer membrane lipoprotein SlyB